MKKIAVILAVMGFGIYLMMTEKDKKGKKDLGDLQRKKLRKSHFPGNDFPGDV